VCERVGGRGGEEERGREGGRSFYFLFVNQERTCGCMGGCVCEVGLHLYKYERKEKKKGRKMKA